MNNLEFYRGQEVNKLLFSKGDFMCRWAFLLFAFLIFSIFLFSSLIKFPQELHGVFEIKENHVYHNISRANLFTCLDTSVFVLKLKNADAIETGQLVNLKFNSNQINNEILIECEVSNVLKKIADTIVIVKFRNLNIISNSNFLHLFNSLDFEGHIELVLKKRNLFSHLIYQYKMRRKYSVRV